MMRPRAVMTGGSVGIGFEMALQLAEQGYDLVLVARNLDRLEKAKAKILDKFSVDVKVMKADLSVDSEVAAFWEEVSQDSALEVLVNNAGFGSYGKFEEISWETQSQMIQLNIASLTRLTYLAVNHFKNNKIRGKILNVASTAGFMPGPMMAVYYATKAFVLSLTEALSQELKKDRIVVSALCPGPTQSEFAEVAGIGQSFLFRPPIAMTSQQVAKIAIRGLLRSRSVIVTGVMNNVLVNLPRLLPRPVIRNIIYQFQSDRKM